MSNTKKPPMYGHVSAKYHVSIHADFQDEVDNILPRKVRAKMFSMAEMLETTGPDLKRPYVGSLNDYSQYPNMKELRFKVDKTPWRVAFAFDPTQNAILLVAGDKSGINQDRFYRKLTRQADNRYAEHLEELQKDRKNAKRE